MRVSVSSPPVCGLDGMDRQLRGGLSVYVDCFPSSRRVYGARRVSEAMGVTALGHSLRHKP